ncbi:MAG: hypothetical protein CMN78_05820 [Spirochaetales bacterium]|nr:hypothetical protein [Spirochaetales bacterium]
MAEIAFRYVAGTSLLHRSDARLKLFGLISLTVCSMYVKSAGVSTLLVAILVSFPLMRIPGITLARELRAFAFLFALIILVKSCKFQVNNGAGRILFSAPGFFDGLLYVGRMAFVVAASLIFISTTKLRAIRDAVMWALHYVPFVPAVRTATMFMLTLTFIPLLFDEAANIRNAQRARALSSRRHPLKAISGISFALILRAFRRVDGVAAAMESRGYSESLRPHPRKLRRSDAYFAVAVLLLGSMAFFLGVALHRRA